MWRYAGLGTELVAGITAFTLLGWWIDRQRGSSPLWTSAGAVVGCVGGLYNLIRQAIRMQAEATRQARGRAPEWNDHDAGEHKP